MSTAPESLCFPRAPCPWASGCSRNGPCERTRVFWSGHTSSMCVGHLYLFFEVLLCPFTLFWVYILRLLKIDFSAPWI